MRRKASNIAFTTVVLGLLSCAAMPSTTNLTPAKLQRDPTISTYRDPSYAFAQLKTFSVFPASLMSNEINMNEIMEKQLLFFVRSLFEGLGYRFVALDQRPDFLVTLNATSQYKETYVPPQTVTVPRWVPGKTITSYGSSQGTFNSETYGDYSSYGWGSYAGTSTVSTYIPGYETTDTFTRPAYKVGYYYPSAVVAVYDARSFRNIWMGTGAGTSRNSDVRISSQLVFTHMVSHFPDATSRGSAAPSSGVVGVIDICLKNAIIDSWGVRYATQGIRRGFGSPPPPGARAAR